MSAPSQVGRETSTVVHCTGTDDEDGSAGERGFLSFDFVHDGGDQDRSGHVAGVSASFTGLSANQVNTGFENLGDVLGMSYHLMGGGTVVLVGWLALGCLTYVHDEDSCGVEFLDGPFRRNANSGHEKGGLLLHVRDEVVSAVSGPLRRRCV